MCQTDGPVDLTITADFKATIVLMCNAKSQPPSVYHWLFNNTVLREDAILTLPLMSPLGSKYTCVARNPLTNDTLSKSYVLSGKRHAASKWLYFELREIYENINK